MRLKLFLLICISLAFVSCGALWHRRAPSSGDRYDYKEDAKHSLLTPHWKYSGYINDGKPRRIVPVMIILGGIAILIVGLIKML